MHFPFRFRGCCKPMPGVVAHVRWRGCGGQSFDGGTMSALRSDPRTAASWLALGVLLACLPMPGAAEDDVLAVSTRSLADVRVAIEASAPAEVHALASSRVPARINAPVEEFRVEVGDSVDAGDVLVRLDCADFTDRLDQAEGRLQELEARRTFALTRRERLERLRDQGAVSAEALDEAVSEVDSLAASVRAQRGTVRGAQRDVTRCDVRAPFAGFVTERPVSTGEWVTAGSELLRLLDPTRVELRAQVPYREMPGDGSFAAAVFRVNGVEHAVELRRVVADVDPDRRMHEVRLRFLDAPPAVGTPGRLHWSRHETAVPANLLVQRDGGLGVMVVEDGHARFHGLVDAIAGRPAPAPDLPADAELIIEGREAAREGQPVTRVGGGADDS